MKHTDYKNNVINFLSESKKGKDEFNNEVVRVMGLNKIIDETIKNNYKPTDMQYLLDGMEQCNFTNEQYEWIEQMLIFADQGKYYEDLKELSPKNFEKEVKEEVKGWGHFKGLKF